MNPENMKINAPDNTVQAVRNLIEHYAVRNVTLERGDKDKAPVMLLPQGLTVHSIKPYLDEYLDKPERRTGTAHMKDLASFIMHTMRFADCDSAIFADDNSTKPCLLTVFDYHRAGNDADPRFCKHRAVYEFPLSDEWMAWKQNNGASKAMSQAEFAEFLENRITDVIASDTDNDEKLKAFSVLLGSTFATPTKLVELSRGLSIHEGVQVKQAVNLGSGEAQITYSSQHQNEAGEMLKVPNLFCIAIPVFRNGPLYQLAVRLRYRLRSGNITWHYELYRAEKTFEHAFQEACSAVAAQTSLPVFVGSPEY